MSGGVDSSVAAALLVEQGHEVIGLTMRLYDAAASEPGGRAGTCCSPAEIDQARDACALLGIPHYTVDERDRFEGRGDRRLRAQLRGRAHPEPVRPLQRARQVRAAAGAGAGPRGRAAGDRALRAQRGRGLWRAVDASKDQSYFLFAMGLPALREVSASRWAPGTRTRCGRRRGPWGSATRTRRTAQELCFVGGGDHAAVVEARAAALGDRPPRSRRARSSTRRAWRSASTRGSIG
jgi:tRNA-specific 2-thiouridylase